MKVIETIAEMSDAADKMRSGGVRIGFVPTMGYLHEGHLSLVRMSKKDNDATLLSIFVNPTQFGPGEDLERYPRDMDGDLAKCRAEGVEIVFAPSAKDMYPAGCSTFVEVEGVSAGLCGAARPGHFRGVATVVTKLFNIVRPHRAYFGQKDYQQTVVIRRMVKDLDMGVEVVAGPTVREPDGLAMSSRNAYLGHEERKAAPCIYRALAAAKGAFEEGERDAARITAAALDTLSKEPGVVLEYLELVDADTLSRLAFADRKAVLAVAARVGRTRLIDNVLIG